MDNFGPALNFVACSASAERECEALFGVTHICGPGTNPCSCSGMADSEVCAFCSSIPVVSSEAYGRHLNCTPKIPQDHSRCNVDIDDYFTFSNSQIYTIVPFCIRVFVENKFGHEYCPSVVTPVRTTILRGVSSAQ